MTFNSKSSQIIPPEAKPFVFHSPLFPTPEGDLVARFSQKLTKVIKEKDLEALVNLNKTMNNFFTCVLYTQVRHI